MKRMKQGTPISRMQAGFTILELMIATMVFTVIFLATTTALLQIGRLYYKGVVSGRTQELARSLTDQISQQLQFSPDSPMPGSVQDVVTGGTDPGGKLTFQSICIGGTRYTYRLNTQVNSTVPNNTYLPSSSRLLHGLWRDSTTPGSCNPVDLSRTSPSANGEEVLGQGMRLTQFSATCNTNTRVCNVTIVIVYGDNDLLTPDPTTVAPGAIQSIHCDTKVGSQWCALSNFSTSVLKRVD